MFTKLYYCGQIRKFIEDKMPSLLLIEPTPFCLKGERPNFLFPYAISIAKVECEGHPLGKFVQPKPVGLKAITLKRIERPTTYADPI
jgi:hypothetical protein